MIIRAATPADQPGIEAVIAAAFEQRTDGHVVAMVRALNAAGATRAGIVAVGEDTEIVGHVQLSRSWIDARPALVEVLVLSPLSVMPSRQGRGIGTRLVDAALSEATRQHAPALFLEGAPAYYGNRGFAAAVPRGFDRPSARIPEAAFQVALLPAHQDWMVGRFVYAEAFWASDAVGLRDPLLRQLEEQMDGQQAQ